MFALKLDDLVREIGSSTVVRGGGVRRERRVLEAAVEPDGTRISGRVKGSRRTPYSLDIGLSTAGERIRIDGRCSCPMRRNCKHVAAVLLEVMERRLALPSSSVTAAAPSPQLPMVAQAKAPELHFGLNLWLQDMAASAKPGRGEDYPEKIRQRLIYVLTTSHRQDGRTETCVKPVVASVLKGGGLGANPKTYDPASIRNYQVPDHLRASDLSILDGLEALKRLAGGWTLHGIRLPATDPLVPRVLADMLKTGRCRWQDHNGPVLAEGPPRRAEVWWQPLAGGRQRLALRLCEGEPGAASAVLPLAPPRYVDFGAGTVGPLDLGLPDALAARLAESIEIAPAEAGVFWAALNKHLETLGLAGRVPAPVTPAAIERRAVKPVPCLHLFAVQARPRQQIYGYRRDQAQDLAPFPLPLARLTFDYDGHALSHGSRPGAIERLEDGKLVIIPRDRRTEDAAVSLARSLDLIEARQFPVDMPADNSCDLVLRPQESYLAGDFARQMQHPLPFLTFVSDVVPRLQREGWNVTITDDHPFRLVDGDVSWWADTGADEGSGIDWFSFEMGLSLGDERISLVPALASFLQTLPRDIVELAQTDDPAAFQAFVEAIEQLPFFHAVPGGGYLKLPHERVAPMLRAMLALIGPKGAFDGRIRISRADAATLADIAGIDGLDVAWAASAEKLIALGRDLRRGRRPEPVLPPPTFKASLRPYQSDGLAWLDFLRDTGFGGVLADDMGLGKTVQTLALLAREKAEGRLDKPALVVAPTSVMPNWQAEAERHAPGLSVLALRGLDRHLKHSQIASHDLVLTTYPLLARDHEILLKEEFHIAILDEAQAIKNPRATVTGLAHRLNARHRLALTGTPLENNLGEVWSLFQFLNPGLLGDEASFKRNFRTPIEKHGDATAQAFLTRRLKPFMLRRTKAEVAADLPPKTEIVEHIRLEGAQRDLYETVRALMHKKVREEIDKKGLAKSHIIFLDALLKLRQVCCDPRLLKLPAAAKVKSSAKLDRLIEMIPELIGEGRRILLFSQFTSMLALIETELKKLKIPYVMLTGATEDRATPVKTFQAGMVPLFLISLKAGGTGLNLTAADTVIHYDPWWNPAVENQATDRAHRIGQTKPVFVHKLIVEEGIEQAIEILKKKKAALADALFAGASKTGLDLTEDDIATLFAPLESVRTPIRKAA